MLKIPWEIFATIFRTVIFTKFRKFYLFREKICSKTFDKFYGMLRKFQRNLKNVGAISVQIIETLNFTNFSEFPIRFENLFLETNFRKSLSFMIYPYHFPIN